MVSRDLAHARIRARISATWLHEVIGGSYKSAWFLEHRIRSAMAPTRSDHGAPVAYVAARAVAQRPRSEPGASETVGADIPESWPLRRSMIAGAHHHVGTKYLAAYWDEVRWRAAHLVNPNAFREMVVALLDHPWLPFKELTGTGAVLEPAL